MISAGDDHRIMIIHTVLVLPVFPHMNFNGPEEFLNHYASISDAKEFVSPSKFETTLSDVDQDVLSRPMSQQLHVQYLSQVQHPQYSNVITGYVHGNMYRPVVNVVMTSCDNVEYGINVIFVIDTASPYTYISRVVARALCLSDDENGKFTMVHGRRTYIHESRNNFSHVNILGGDWLSRCTALDVHYKTSQVTILIE